MNIHRKSACFTYYSWKFRSLNFHQQVRSYVKDSAFSIYRNNVVSMNSGIRMGSIWRTR